MSTRTFSFHSADISTCPQIFTGEIPWAGLRDGQVIVEVLINKNRPSRPPEPAMQRGLDDEMWNLMTACWRTQPRERPGMVSIVEKLMPGHGLEEELRARNHPSIPKSDLLLFKTQW